MRHRIKWLLSKFHWLPDTTFLRWGYRLETGRRLELDSPVTFNDKLNWLKLHGDTGRYAPLVDKLAVRDFVERVIGPDYLVPLIAVYKRASDILLPCVTLPERCVIKCSHGSHCMISCHDKATFDRFKAVKKLKKWMRTNWFWYGREPPYRSVPPRVMVEALLGDGVKPPIDYKFMCFGGEPEIVQVHRRLGGRVAGITTIDFYAARGERLNMRKRGYPNGRYPYVERSKIKDMLPVARALARATGAPYVRVDLYHEGGKVYFSELTFFDSAGFRDFEPREVNVKLGGMIDIGKGSGSHDSGRKAG